MLKFGTHKVSADRLCACNWARGGLFLWYRTIDSARWRTTTIITVVTIHGPMDILSICRQFSRRFVRHRPFSKIPILCSHGFLVTRKGKHSNSNRGNTFATYVCRFIHPCATRIRFIQFIGIFLTKLHFNIRDRVKIPFRVFRSKYEARYFNISLSPQNASNSHSLGQAPQS